MAHSILSMVFDEEDTNFPDFSNLEIASEKVIALPAGLAVGM